MKRALEQLANDIDNAKTTVEELEAEKSAAQSPDESQKLKEVRKSLEDASDCVDELEERKKR